jgi:ribosomal protein S18 acetylase RimI-like enzyme
VNKDVVIKKVTVKDAESLRNLRLQLVKENPKTFGVVYSTERKKGLKHFADLIKEHEGKDSGIFVLIKDNKLVGMGIVRRDDKKDDSVGYLGSLGILKEYQSKGLGKYLLEYRLGWISKNTKFKKIKTIVLKENIKMLNLAKKYGFQIVGEGKYRNLPEYYLEKTLK